MPRIVRAVTDRLWERDRRQMRAIDALVAAGTRAAPRSVTRPRRPATTRAPKCRTVLCAVDFSRHSQRALQYADVIAARSRASLTVLYVADPLLVAAAAAKLNDRQLITRREDELRTFVAVTLGRSGASRRRPKTQVATGDPADEILDVARRIRADVIVLGTHGATGVQSILMGSTTRNVLKRATMPVLACPPRRRKR